MNFREGILDTFADGLETIVQVRQYLKYLKIEVSEKQIFDELSLLLKEEKIEITYPPELKNNTTLDPSIIEDYWFEMTPAGREEWSKIVVEDDNK